MSDKKEVCYILLSTGAELIAEVVRPSVFSDTDIHTIQCVHNMDFVELVNPCSLTINPMVVLSMGEDGTPTIPPISLNLWNPWCQKEENMRIRTDNIVTVVPVTDEMADYYDSTLDWFVKKETEYREKIAARREAAAKMETDGEDFTNEVDRMHAKLDEQGDDVTSDTELEGLLEDFMDPNKKKIIH